MRIVGYVRRRQALPREQVDAAGHAVAEQKGLDKRQIDAARILAKAHRRLGELAAAHEVAVGNADLGEETVGGGVAARDGELAGRHFLDVDIDDDPVGCRARLVGDLYRLEIVQVLQPALGAVDQRAIIGIALADIEFAADHVVAGAGIAENIDALDIGARAFLDHENEIDDLLLKVAVAARTHTREGVAVLGRLDRHRLDAPLDQIGVVDTARAELEAAAQRCRIDRAHVRHHVEGADVILAALIDGEGDEEALLVRVVFADRRDDAHVRIAVFEIEAAQQVAIGFHPVRIVDVGGLQEAEPIALGGFDHVLQTAGRIRIRANEADLPHAGFRTFGDLEDQIDAIVRQLDDLRLDLDVEAAAAVIDFDDALHVGLHGRPRQRPARLRLHFDLELVVLGFLIAFEGNTIDHRILDHGDHQPAARMVNAHVLEQAGGNERLKPLVFLLDAQPSARARLEIGLDGRGLDPPVASHVDGIGALRGRNARRRHTHKPGTDKGTPEDHTAEGQSPQKPHTKSHALRAFIYPCSRPRPRCGVDRLLGLL